MANINLILEKDIPNLEYRKMDWDVVINGIPYQVIKVNNHVHTIGGKLDHGDGNSFWAYPLNEKLSYDSLTQFNGTPGARWGFVYKPIDRCIVNWGMRSISSGMRITITRNDEPFYSGFMTFYEAASLIFDNKLDEHPLDLNMRYFDTKVIGRKIWYRSEPAIVKRYVKGEACVMIIPDGMDAFSVPAEYTTDDMLKDDEPLTMVKETIFSNHIYWYRN